MIFSILLIVTSIVISLMALILLYQYFRHGSEKPLLYLGVSFVFLAIWGVTSVLNTSVNVYEIVLLSTRASYAAGIFMLLFLSPFIESIFNPKVRINPATFYLSVIFSIIVVFTNLIVDIVQFNESSGSNPVLGKYFVVYVIYILPYFYLTFRNSIISAKLAAGEMLLRFKYVLVGLLISTTGVILTSFVLPLLGATQYIPFGFVWTLPTVLFSGYSFLFNRIFDIRYLLGKFVTNLLYVLLTFIVYNLVSYVQINLWGSIFNTNAYTIGLVFAIIFVVGSNLFMRFVTNIITNKFIYIKYDPRLLVTKFREDIENELNKKNLVKILDRNLNKLFQAEYRQYIFSKGFVDQNPTGFVQYSFPENTQFSLSIKELNDFASDYKQNKSRVITEVDLVKPSHKKLFRKCKLSAIGITSRGYILIGKLGRYSAFTINSVILTEQLIDLVSISFFRADIYEDLEVYNKSLESRVNSATKQLRAKVAALQEARQKEQDMIDIMGHELRTPATIVNLNMDLMETLWNQLGIKDPKSDIYIKYKKYADRINDGIDREIKLINILLASAKIDGKRLVLNKESVNIIKAIELGIQGQQKEASHKNLHLTFNKPRGADNYPLVYGDKVRLQEIIDNLINNAVKYTDDGGVIVGVSHSNDFVDISVVDTGQGIPKDAIKNLGKKFYRVGQYTGKTKVSSIKKKDTLDLVRPGGTGLGLYVTFGLVKAHGGKIIVTSEIGKGTTFVVKLPIYKKSDKSFIDSNDKDMFLKIGLTK